MNKLKILIQSGDLIVDMPREIWVTPYGCEGFAIIGTTYLGKIFGIYKTESRAKEVLREMYAHYGDNIRCYEMPQE